MFRKPYTPELISLLGRPVAPEEVWNPDAVLRVEDIHHHPNTQERLDKAAATQMVFEDALIHIVDCLIRTTGSDRLVLTGGAALNAVANMRLLEKFDESYYSRVLGRRTQLHLWVPPVPGDAGATVGRGLRIRCKRRGWFWAAAQARILLRTRLEHFRNPRSIEECRRFGLDGRWRCVPSIRHRCRCRPDGLHHRQGRHHWDIPGISGDRSAGAGSSIYRRQCVQSAYAQLPQRASQVSRANPSTSSDGNTDGRKGPIRAMRGRVG